MTSTTVAPAPVASGMDAPFDAPFRVAAIQTVTAIDVDANLVRADALLAEAQRSVRQRDEFLAMLGHELRNPVGTVRNAIEVLENVSREGDGTEAEQRAIIRRQARHIEGADEIDPDHPGCGRPDPDPG